MAKTAYEERVRGDDALRWAVEFFEGEWLSGVHPGRLAARGAALMLIAAEVLVSDGGLHAHENREGVYDMLESIRHDLSQMPLPKDGVQ
jgi:hypothetical protein